MPANDKRNGNPGRSPQTDDRYVALFLQNKPYLGNQIALVPLFEALRQADPQRGIIVCAHHRSAEALVALGFVDVLLPGPGRPFSFINMLLALRRYRIEQTFMLRRHSIKTGLLARLVTRGEVVGFSARTTNLFLNRRSAFDIGVYAADNALSLIGRQLPVASEAGPKPMDGYFLIIPGGSLPQKKYPIGRYIDLAEALAATAPVHFLLGSDMTDEIGALDPYADRFVLHINRPLVEVAEIVDQSAVVIANDCGPAHFAHIRNTPRVLLFADAGRAGHWCRVTDRLRMLKSPVPGEIRSIDSGAILDAAMGLYSGSTVENG